MATIKILKKLLIQSFSSKTSLNNILGSKREYHGIVIFSNFLNMFNSW